MTARRRVQAGLAAILAVLVLWLIFTGPDDAGGSGGETAGERPVDGRVSVLAAASLSEPFERLADDLAERYPELDVVMSFGPSSGLVEQALAGAPADVLATADRQTMDVAVEAGVVEGEPVVFARNTLALIVPAGNPGEVRGLADLARDELLIATCEPQVPCGAATRQLLAAAGVVAAPDTLTTDVKEAMSLVSLGEADAALVYRTDAIAAGDAVETIAVPGAETVVNDYPVARLADAPNADAAQVVIKAITGEPGRAVLGAAGFVEP